MKKIAALVLLLPLLFVSEAVAADFVAVNKAGDVEMLSAREARSLKRGQYLAVERNRPVQLDTWGLDRINQRALPLDSLRDSFGGAGVTVYVIDSGIDAAHSLLAGRVERGMSTWNTDPWNDCAGHGTAVSGVIAGQTYGVAPEARLVPVQAFTCMGFGWLDTVLPALEWIRDHHRIGQPAVLNASFGLPTSPTLQLLFRQILDDGIAVAASAGNSAEDACVRTPANVPELITTAASNTLDARASFSNWGKCVDLFAPGENVQSLAPGNGLGGYSGTSWAAPHVAGAMTRILAQNPTLSPRSLSDTILRNTTPNVISNALSANRLLYLGRNMPITNYAPAHDSFATPRALKQGTAQKASNRDASRQADEPAHGNSSLWYTITLSSSAAITLSSSGSSFPARFSLYRGSSLSGLSLIARSKKAKNSRNLVTGRLAKGTYRLAVTGNEAVGDFQVLWRK